MVWQILHFFGQRDRYSVVDCCGTQLGTPDGAAKDVQCGDVTSLWHDRYAVMERRTIRTRPKAPECSSSLRTPPRASPKPGNQTMFNLKLIASVAFLVSVSQALYFHLEPFSVSDVRIPSESHSISFTISNPDAVFEQGGTYPRNCSIAWSVNTTPFSCPTDSDKL